MLARTLQSFSGNSGILSFGHMALFGTGAYVAGILTLDPALKSTYLPSLPHFLQDANPRWWIALALAAAAGGVLALLSGIPILLSMVVGVVVSVFQAATQIQEQTLTFVPKIVAMIAAAVLLMPWIGERLLGYAAEMFSTGLTP